ncbi:hypothetical protein VNO77_35136 [Canavalia gladiata]|uniref:Uncharacterized protein n=1 Tax=Canavalia gladiata TaxID=3824 RepID=A0AAN9PYV4_CANGL
MTIYIRQLGYMCLKGCAWCKETRLESVVLAFIFIYSVYGSSNIEMSSPAARDLVGTIRNSPTSKVIRIVGLIISGCKKKGIKTVRFKSLETDQWLGLLHTSTISCLRNSSL